MTKETGTLAELNVKPGDVVEWISNGGLHTIITSQKVTKGSWVGQIRANLSEYGYGIFGDEMFRLVSRASDTERDSKPVDVRGDEDHTPLADMGFSTVEATVSGIYKEPTTLKTWGEMTDEEQGALLLKHHRGEVIESSSNGTGWALDDNVGYSNTLYYRVRPPEPKRETVELRAGGLLKAWEAWSDDDDTHRITFDVIDGTPDCASIRMEEL